MKKSSSFFKLSIFAQTLVFTPFLISTKAYGVVLVQTNDPGFYNNNIGTILNLSNTGVDDANEPFPLSNDSNTSFPSAPNLSSADTVLGNWLNDPLNLNSNWSSTPISIPNSWAVGTEVAVIYQFDTLSATNVVARFGVDNGIFAWLDGEYLFGERAGGGPSLGEYELNLGDLDAGTHHLQLLLEDHGVTNGYAVEITADEFIPGSPPNPESEPEPPVVVDTEPEPEPELEPPVVVDTEPEPEPELEPPVVIDTEPEPEPPVAVPEPSSIMSLLISTFAMVAYRFISLKKRR